MSTLNRNLLNRMNLPVPSLPHCGKLRGWLRCLSRFTIHSWQSCNQPNTKRILGKLLTNITTNPFQVHCDSSTGVAHCGRCMPAGISIYSTLQCSAHIGLTMSYGVSHDVLNSLDVVPDVPSLLSHKQETQQKASWPPPLPSNLGTAQKLNDFRVRGPP